MVYQSRKRNFKSRRERYQQVSRNTRITILFFVIALGVWLFMSRHELWNWYKTYLY